MYTYIITRVRKKRTMTHFIDIRRISCLDNFLSGGCVGTNFLNSAKAPLTFCCRHRSLLFVNNFLPPRPPVRDVGDPSIPFVDEDTPSFYNKFIMFQILANNLPQK